MRRSNQSSAVLHANRARFIGFFGLAFAVVVIWVALLRGDVFARHPVVGAWGATFDLLVSVPLLYYLLLVRPGRVSGATMIPIVVGSLVAADAIVPHDHRGLLVALGAAAELGILGWIIVRARRALRDSDGEHSTLLEAAETVVRSIAPHPVAAEVIVSELSIVWYAVASWKAKRVAHDRAYGWRDVDGWGSIVIGFGLVIILESAAIHLWLARSHPVGAWIVTALDLYGILWLVADYRALGLTSVELTREGLDVRFGFRWAVSVPVAAIEAVGSVRSGDERWDLKLALIEPPDILVILREPVRARGPYGIRRSVARIGLRVDDAARFECLARERGLWRDPEPAIVVDVERGAKPARADGAVDSKPRFRMSREKWLATRPDYVSVEDWERSRPDWVES